MYNRLSNSALSLLLLVLDHIYSQKKLLCAAQRASITCEVEMKAIKVELGTMLEMRSTRVIGTKVERGTIYLPLTHSFTGISSTLTLMVMAMTLIEDSSYQTVAIHHAPASQTKKQTINRKHSLAQAEIVDECRVSSLSKRISVHFGIYP
ncbi:hypothetical protein BCV71DRAFT_232528 [Rhizopus microsporus]|uniref:Secreted protein n=1 Tax=Rhizopus microsporus TaxID=58291 RepID=A0A1X0S9Y9_RHIZD|nr:hypothetical protein BCV71DRAFT_232528 [Rhizopus microsporus]